MDTAREARERRERLAQRDHEERVHGGSACTCDVDGALADAAATIGTEVAELLREARRMSSGTTMLRRHAARQGWQCDATDADERLLDAAVFLAAAGRTWGDVLRGMS